MSKLVHSYREVTRAYEHKLGLDFRSGSERNAWYTVDGRKTHRLTLPHGHSGDIRPGTLSKVVNQCRLTPWEFDALVQCPMSAADYEAKIRRMIEEGIM
ncbi:MAG: hypothetical protein HYY01_00430 [Chloroflexi bacterium]|nr:hypothetical protein [Chloroflexota bacterium]